MYKYPQGHKAVHKKSSSFYERFFKQVNWGTDTFKKIITVVKKMLVIIFYFTGNKKRTIIFSFGFKMRQKWKGQFWTSNPEWRGQLHVNGCHVSKNYIDVDYSLEISEKQLRWLCSEGDDMYFNFYISPLQPFKIHVFLYSFLFLLPPNWVPPPPVCLGWWCTLRQPEESVRGRPRRWSHSTHSWLPLAPQSHKTRSSLKTRWSRWGEQVNIVN